MKVKVWLLAVLPVLVFSILSPGVRAEEAKPFYATVKVGFYAPQSDDLDALSADAGLDLEAAFGYRINPHFAVELGSGFFFTEGEFQDPVFGTVDDTFAAVPVTVTLRAIAPAGRVEPYLAVGTGIYFVNEELEADSFGFTTTQDDSDTAFGLHAGVGVNIHVSRLVYVGAELRYLWLEVETFGIDTELDGLFGTVNVGFKF